MWRRLEQVVNEARLKHSEVEVTALSWQHVVHCGCATNEHPFFRGEKVWH
jgi:hypothetical protein